MGCILGILKYVGPGGGGQGGLQQPYGRLTLKIAKGGHPQTWGPSVATEEDPDGRPRVNTLACIWQGRLFPASILPPTHPQFLPVGAALEGIPEAQRDAGCLGTTVYSQLPPIPFHLPLQQGPGTTRPFDLSKPGSFSFLLLSPPAPSLPVA